MLWDSFLLFMLVLTPPILAEPTEPTQNGTVVESEIDYIHEHFAQVNDKLDVIVERLEKLPENIHTECVVQPSVGTSQKQISAGRTTETGDISSRLKSIILERRFMDSKNPIQSKKRDHPVLVFVVAPESSGNRYIVDVFVKAAGCFGKSAHQQPLDQKGKPMKKDWSLMDGRVLTSIKNSHSCAVIHRSYPHNFIFVDLSKMARQSREKGFEPRIVVITRYNEAVEASQLKRKHVNRREKARENFYRSYLEIFRHIIVSKLRYVLITYELMKDPTYVQWMFDEIGIPYNKDRVPLFKHANEKYVEL